MTTFNAIDRERVRDKLIADRFDAEIEAARAVLAEEGDRLYTMALGPELIGTIESLPPGICRKSTAAHLYFTGADRGVTIRMTRKRVPAGADWHNISEDRRFELDPVQFERYNELERQLEALNKARSRASRSLLRVLQSVTSAKMAAEMFPEVAGIIGQRVSANKATKADREKQIADVRAEVNLILHNIAPIAAAS